MELFKAILWAIGILIAGRYAALAVKAIVRKTMERSRVDSSANFAVRPWVKTDDHWDVYFATQEAIKKRFDAEGISIPFPQQDVHIHKNDGSTKKKRAPNPLASVASTGLD